MALIMTLIWMLALPVKAHEVPDLTREGSITVTMRYDGKAISGGATIKGNPSSSQRTIKD